MSQLTLTEEQKDLFKHIDSITPADGHLVHDLTDPKQLAFVNLMNELSGRTREAFPGSYQLLEDIKTHQEQHGFQLIEKTDDPNDPWVTSFDVLNVGTTPDNFAAANGQGTVVGGANSMNLALYVVDYSGHIIAQGSNESYVATPVLTVKTNDVNPTSPRSTTAYLNYSYQPSGFSAAAGDIPGASGTVSRQSANGPVADPVLTQPVRTSLTPFNPNALNIGLGRAWTVANTDLDYWWNQPVQANPIGMLPFVGNVVFPSAIQPLQRGAAPNFMITIKVTNGTGGGAAVLSPTDMATVNAAFNVDPNNSSNLIWSLPAGTAGFPAGNPIVFSSIPWVTDLLAYFSCYIMVTLTNGLPAFASVISSVQPDTDPLDGTKYIMPVEFIWHCLAEGTQVLLADNSTKAIEDFVSGDVVQTDNNGNTATVSGTRKGVHTGDVLSITTLLNGQGHTITATDHHTFFRGTELVCARELQVKDEIATIDGLAKITQIDILKDYNGMFYNLALGKNASDNGKIGTFYANGILTGDSFAQRNLTELHANDKEWLKAQLGSYWATDIESHFARK